MMIFSFSVVILMGLGLFQFRWIKWEMLLNCYILLLSMNMIFMGLRSEELLKLNLFMDGLSYVLLLLTVFITSLMLTGSYSSVKYTHKSESIFLVLLLVMMMILSYTFLESRFIYFFILFESVLIPIFLLIMGWGYQPERLQASLYMLFYTIFASLPMLVAILFYSEDFKMFSGVSFLSGGSSTVLSFFLSFMLVFAFLIKLPMFFVHLWLPKAHVEAPVAGSMILAGILLKLGGYGIWRVSKFIMGDVLWIASTMVVMGVVGGVIVSLVCAIQIDMKSLVAYSSVVHMGILLAGMFTFSSFGYQGAFAMMIGHGAVSSGLFFLVGALYDRFSSRSVFVSKGLLVLFPFMSAMWFLLVIQNISAPPSITLLSEILLVVSLVKNSIFLIPFLMMMNFMAMVYSFYLYSYTQHGRNFSSILSSQLFSVRESAVVLMHPLPVLFLVLVLFIFSF